MPKPAARSAFFQHVQEAPATENVATNVAENVSEDVPENVNVHVSDNPDQTLRRKRGGEERQTTTFRIRPSVAKAFNAFCEQHEYAKGPALEAAIEAFIARESQA